MWVLTVTFWAHSIWLCGFFKEQMLVIGECERGQSGGGNGAFMCFFFVVVFCERASICLIAKINEVGNSPMAILQRTIGEILAPRKSPLSERGWMQEPRIRMAEIRMGKLQLNTVCVKVFTSYYCSHAHTNTQRHSIYSAQRWSHHRLVSLWEEVGHFLRRSCCSFLMYYRLRLSKNNASGL